MLRSQLLQVVVLGVSPILPHCSYEYEYQYSPKDIEPVLYVYDNHVVLGSNIRAVVVASIAVNKPSAVQPHHDRKPFGGIVSATGAAIAVSASAGATVVPFHRRTPDV